MHQEKLEWVEKAINSDEFADSIIEKDVIRLKERVKVLERVVYGLIGVAVLQLFEILASRFFK